jgi:nitronate monooxygenase
VSIIKTPYIEKIGTKAGGFTRWMLQGNKTKHWMRMFYTLRSAFQLRKSSLDERGETEFWQAGKSVTGIHQIEPVATVIGKYETALQELNWQQKQA